MGTTLRNCRVPWSISPSGSGVTLIHEETDVSPKCRVVLAAGRLAPDGRTDWRRIELQFDLAYFARTTPHDDSQSPSDYGFHVADRYQGDMDLYLQWRKELWTDTGICPDSGFYVASQSDWLESVPDFYRQRCKHYLFDGRDGHVELLASQYRWTEWIVAENNKLEWSDVWPVVSAIYQSEGCR